MKKPSLKALGLFATVAGFGLTLLNSFVSNKQQDLNIEKKVREALSAAKEKG